MKRRYEKMAVESVCINKSDVIEIISLIGLGV